jgi:hypothetical protein
MDATRGIMTVKKHLEELDHCTNKPSFTLEVLQERDPQEPFISTIVCEMEKLQKHVIATIAKVCISKVVTRI